MLLRHQGELNAAVDENVTRNARRPSYNWTECNGSVVVVDFVSYKYPDVLVVYIGKGTFLKILNKI